MEDLSSLLNTFVDEMDKLAYHICEYYKIQSNYSVTAEDSEEGTALIASLSSLTEGCLLCQAELIKMSLDHIQSVISSEINIPILEHQARIKELNKNTQFVRVANAAAQPDTSGTDSEEQLKHYKEVETLILAYRSLLLQFNACIHQYNSLHQRAELKPLASTDISPLR
jgi:hypothetical protein